MTERPKVGDVAVCQAGCVGLVCGITRVARGPKFINRKLWVGVHLGRVMAGRRWESRAPKKLLTPSQFLNDKNYQS
jgi:hypothetical protein